MKVLITGGAGFIGAALAQELVERHNAQVVSVDNLLPQVHEDGVLLKRYPATAKLVRGDVRNGELLDCVLDGLQPDYVVHFAAETGTAQSMTHSSRHASVNGVGTTELLDSLRRVQCRPRRILLSSSRAIYGEGAWQAEDGNLFYPGIRSRGQLSSGNWDFCGADGKPAVAMLHNAATVLPNPTSIYGATKLVQEHLLKAWCAANEIPYHILRFQNVYGIGQSPSNPYTGIINIFHRIARRKEVIPVYEDGEIGRDFVWISDVVDACVAALLDQSADCGTYDVGSGEATTVAQAAAVVAALHGAPSPRVTGQFREGDVRWAVADVSALKANLGVVPKVSFEEGASRVGEWLFDGTQA
ncbi:NAD-dependent epimerase/dehydratase family protein [Burkholderia sp. LS-044]|uniref:NAD-dependent epimerase/dehydratase family protein n=1 Tax=Burkholderia TaxID=32008 RepID=UPI0010A63E89|nr:MULTISPECIES: NAD-dependent epimerase/dehydratase family protein [Burkholderia]THJ49545.1 NAD-dependent epimerase/dehydratase family protein [Burkholderia sp. LS-044]